jgi:hypothetical protein
MSVLAKAWLEQFAPVVTMRQANDTCCQYRLDKQVESWRMGAVITLVQLCVQVASFLFLAGLIVQCFIDDRVVGYLLLAFFIAGGVVYFIVSLLPLLAPLSPFWTPLLGFFSLSKKASVEPILCPLSDVSTDDMDLSDDEVLVKILKLLLKSPKSEHIDEAAAEIALPSFKPKWIQRLCTDEVPQYLLFRFKRCIATTTQNLGKRNAILRNHLLAFLQFVDYFEGEIPLFKTYPLTIDHWNLLITLQKSLASTHPFH